MNRQLFIQSPLVNRRLPLLTNKPFQGEAKKGGRCAEVVGGTAADCAAVCCCCPCGLMNLLVLAVYKVPAGLCKKVWKKKKKGRMKKKKGLWQPQKTAGGPTCGSEESTTEMIEGKEEKAGDGMKEAADLEKEMWDRFCGTGFWRSPSQRGES
ncbi:hypothetical protein L1049_014046 [Liquidambar formosana]|uniref:Uncharacterized protein n=1 Tax=Liquidambar formosana TaxID=63359 RepID=A0AAP0WUW6_LIQFO